MQEVNRVCETCRKGINAGYVIDDGAYCSLVCGGWSQSEWDEYNAFMDNDGDNYYTEWEEDPSPEAELYNALAKAVNQYHYNLKPEEVEKMFYNVLVEELKTWN